MNVTKIVDFEVAVEIVAMLDMDFVEAVEAKIGDLMVFAITVTNQIIKFDFVLLNKMMRGKEFFVIRGQNQNSLEKMHQ